MSEHVPVPAGAADDGRTAASPDRQGRSGRLSILLVTPGYPPVVGGAETHVSRLAATLVRRGHRVRVLTMWAPPMPDADRWLDPARVPVRAIGRSLPGALRPRAFVSAVALALLGRRRRYDVLQVFLPGLHVPSALLAAAAVGVPAAVMFGAAGDVPILRRTRFGRLQLWTVRRLARRVVILNQQMRNDVLELGIPDIRVAMHPCSVDPSDFGPLRTEDVAALRARNGVPADARVVLFTGRLVEVKALPTLMGAIGIVRRSLPRALLVVVGDGPLRTSLQAAAERLAGPGGVRFVGQLAPAGVRDHLQLSDAFAFVSSSEGIPCSVIEAMSCALPCVVSDAPGVAQLIENGVHGIVVRAGDPGAAADALRLVLSDRPLAAALGAAARQRAMEKYSSDVVASDHERMYRAMIASTDGDTPAAGRQRPDRAPGRA